MHNTIYVYHIIYGVGFTWQKRNSLNFGGLWLKLNLAKMEFGKIGILRKRNLDIFSDNFILREIPLSPNSNIPAN